MKSHRHRIAAACLALMAVALCPETSFARLGPGITTQPQNQNVLAGSNAVFTVVATGQTPLLYQWAFNTTNLTNSAHVGGATNATLTISNVVAGDAGNYKVVVSNSHGSITSSNAALKVLVPAAITGQPTDQSVLLSSNATFSATATGTAPVNCQWYFNGTALTDGTGFSGSATTNLNLLNVQPNEAGNYQLVVTNNYGSATSSIATLIVLTPPSITIQPTNQAALIGGTIVFYSGATSQSPMSYQWAKDGNAVINGGRISGADTPTLTISNLQMCDVGNYQFEAGNTNGTAASTPASLMIVPLVGWGVNYFGEQTFPLTLTNVMAIATGDANLSYLNLMLKADSSVIGWGSVIGTSNYNLTIPADLSNAVAISAGHTHGLVLENDGTVVAFGDNSSGEATPPGGLSSVAAVAAGDGWSLALKDDGTVVAWGDNSYGEATPPPGLTNVVAISAGGVHGLALKDDGTVVGWGYNTVGEGIAPAGLSNVVAIAAGYWHNLALKSDGTVVGWGDNLYGESSPPAGLSNVIAIAASYTLSLALRNDGMVVPWGDNFYGQSTLPPGLSNVVAIAAGGEYGLALLQNPATHIPPTIWWQGETNQIVPSDQTFLLSPCVNGSQPMSFQWYFNDSPLAGQTNSWLMVQSIQPGQAGNYQFTASNNYGSVTSQVTAVIESPGILNQPISQSSLAGGTIAFSATAAGSGTLFYQWYFNGSPLADDGRVNGSTTTNLTISNVQSNDIGSYELVVTNSYGSATSQAATFTLLLPANITSQPVSTSVVLSNNAAFSAAAGGTAPLLYQWFSNGSPLTDGGPISGSSTTNLSIANVQTNDGGLYQLIVTNNYGVSTSSVVTLTVLLPAIITSQPTNLSVVLSSNAVFSASAIGDAPLNYQWYFNGTPLTDGGQVSGSTTTNLTIANIQTNNAGPYQLIVTNNYGSATSAVANLTELFPATITSQPTNRIATASSNASFTVAAAGTAPLNYQWYFGGTVLTNGGRISGATSANLAISNTQTNDSGAYQAIVTNDYGSATSSVATLTVDAPVQITCQPASQAVLLSSNVSFTVTAVGTALNYQWYFNGTLLSDGGRIGGSVTPTLSITNVQSGDAGGYVVVVSNLLNSMTSLTASLTPQAVLAPSVRYVALTSTNPLPPYLDWSTAATNIQDAIDAAVAGDSIIVSNGIYNSGGRVVYGTVTNRIAVTKTVAVQSVNGPAVTTIYGFPRSLYIRCAYLTNGASLIGFTLTNGGTFYLQSSNQLWVSGAGVFCESSATTVSNCVIAGNTSAYFGGGAFRGTLINCLLTNNSGLGGGAASNILINCTLENNNGADGQGPGGGGDGGGAYSSTLTDCVVSNNTAGYGGGIYYGIANNSLIVSNHASIYGGGADYATLNICSISNNYGEWGGAAANSILNACLVTTNRANYGGGAYSNVLNNCILENNFAQETGGGAYLSTLLNCTVVSNAAPSGAGINGGAATNSIIYYNYYGGVAGNNINSKLIAYTCTTPVPGFPGNITNAPLFVNPAGGDFHLQSNSPCINSGFNPAVTVTNDFDGNPRIVGGTVDIGAYEYQTPASVISYAFLQQYGLPTDGSLDYSNLDGTAFNVYQDWIAGLNPTNSASVLAMSPLVSTNYSTGVTISWQSVNTRTYYLQRSTNLSASPAFITIQSNIVGQAGSTSYTDATATNGGPYFYRVGVQ